MTNELEFHKGDSKNLIVTVVDGSGIAVNLTNYLVIFSMKANKKDTAYITQKKNLNAGGSESEIAMTDPTHGKVTIILLPADTSGLRNSGSDYVYDVEIRNGNVVKTVIDSTITLLDEVTTN